MNKGRASADTKLAGGDVVRVPPVRMAAPAAAGRGRAAARVPDPVRGRAPDRHRQAVRHRRARRLGRQLRRHRAAAPRAARAEVPRAGAPARPRDLRHPAARQEAQRAGGAAGAVPRRARPARPTPRWSSARWPAKLKVIDVALHKTEDAGGERRVRAGRRRPRRRPALDLAGAHRAAVRRHHAAGRHDQDRPHAPDPRPPAARGPRDRRRRQVRRLRAQPPLRARRGGAGRALRAHVPARPPARASTIPPAARASSSSRRCRPNAPRSSPRLRAPASAMTDSTDRPRRFDLVVFDWDGTLFDSTALIVHSIQAACRDLGAAGARRRARLVGDRPEPALRRWSTRCPSLTPEQIPQMVDRYRFHYLARQHDLTLFPGVLDMLHALKTRHHWLAVATGKSRARPGRGAARRSSCKGLFDGTRTADETRSKPDPQMLHELMRQFGVDARAHADDRRHHARPAAGRQRRHAQRRGGLRRARARRSSRRTRRCSSPQTWPSWPPGWTRMPEAVAAPDGALPLCASAELEESGKAARVRRAAVAPPGARLRAALRGPRRRLPEPLRARAHRDGLAARRVPRRRAPLHPVLDARRGLRADQRPLHRAARARARA